MRIHESNKENNPTYILKAPGSNITINKSDRELILYILYLHLQEHKNVRLLEQIINYQLKDCADITGMSAFTQAIRILSINLVNKDSKYKQMKLKDIVEELL